LTTCCKNAPLLIEPTTKKKGRGRGKITRLYGGAEKCTVNFGKSKKKKRLEGQPDSANAI